MILENLQLHAQNVPIPLQSVDTKFNFTAQMLSDNMPFSGSQAEGHGWVNIQDRNADATLEVKEPNGVIGLSATITAQNNDATVKGRVNISSLHKKKVSAESKSSVEDMIFEALQSSQVDIRADFNLKTKLDSFDLTTVSFTGNVETGKTGSLKESLKNIGEKVGEIGKKFMEKDGAQVNPDAEKDMQQNAVIDMQQMNAVK
jgi:hypothetical protein